MVTWLANETTVLTHGDRAWTLPTGTRSPCATAERVVLHEPGQRRISVLRWKPFVPALHVSVGELDAPIVRLAGRRLLVASRDGRVLVADGETGRVLAALRS